MKKVLLLTCFLLTGCYTRASLQQADAEMLSESLSYFKDTRTGTCYSGAYLRVDGAIWTSVQCTPAIEKSAVHFRSRP